MVAANRFARTSTPTSLGSAISVQKAAMQHRKAQTTSRSTVRSSGMRRPTAPERRSARENQARRRETARRLSRPEQGVPARQLLRLATVTAPTLGSYRARLAEFQQWVLEKNRLLESDTADGLMCEYFAEKYLAGKGPAMGRYLRSAWILLKTKGSEKCNLLPESRKALAGWEKRAPGQVRDGLPEAALGLLTRWMLDNRRKESAYVLVLQYDGYLRPSEALNLIKVNIVPPQPQAGQLYSGEWSIVLGDSEQEKTTKTGLKDVGIRVGVGNRRWVRDHLKRLYDRARQPQDRLFRVSLQQYEKDFKQGCQELGLNALKGCPHAVRHSGPSEDRLHNRLTLQEVQQRGHWKSHSSVVRYEKHSRILRQLSKMTGDQQRVGTKAWATMSSLLRFSWE